MTPATIDASTAGTWTLGDLTVNRLGFGAMRLTGSAAFNLGTPSDRDGAIAVLRQAVQLGVNHIDTAAFYFSALRSANELINRALYPYPEGLVIVTKVGPGRDPSGTWLPWARPDQLRGQVEENLRQLGRDHLDVVNLRVDGPGSIADHFGALADLRTEGLIRYLGVSGVDIPQLDEAAAIAPVVCVQNLYNVARRGDDAIVDLTAAQGIGYVPYFPLGGMSPVQSEALQAVADRLGATPMAVALAWLLRRSPNILLIPGTSSVAHLRENVAAAALQLPDDAAAQLDAIGG